MIRVSLIDLFRSLHKNKGDFPLLPDMHRVYIKFLMNTRPTDFIRVYKIKNNSVDYRYMDSSTNYATERGVMTRWVIPVRQSLYVHSMIVRKGLSSSKITIVVNEEN